MNRVLLLAVSVLVFLVQLGSGPQVATAVTAETTINHNQCFDFNTGTTGTFGVNSECLGQEWDIQFGFNGSDTSRSPTLVLRSGESAIIVGAYTAEDYVDVNLDDVIDAPLPLAFSNPIGNPPDSNRFSEVAVIETKPEEKFYKIELVNEDRTNLLFKFRWEQLGEPGEEPVLNGSIHGTKWLDINGDGIQGDDEPGLAGVEICLTALGVCTPTMEDDPSTAVVDETGEYWFEDLPLGVYEVSETVPLGMIPTTPSVVNVTVIAGEELEDVDFGNREPTPFPADMELTSSFGHTEDGIPRQASGEPLIVQKSITVCTPFEDPLATLTFPDGTTFSAPMSSLGDDLWRVVFIPPFPSGVGALRVDIDCGPFNTPDYPADPSKIGDDDVFQLGDIVFIDPSGTILNSCTGTDLEGVEVTLLHEPVEGDPFVKPPLSDHFPKTNPQTTPLDGSFGWMVVPGSYKVKATLAGFTTETSGVLDIPPPAVGLVIELTPVGGCNEPPTAEDDGVSTQNDTPVTIDVLDNDTDPNAGDELAVTNLTNGANGTTAEDGDQIVYTPAAGFIGVDTFTYTANDGLLDSSAATVTIVVTDSCDCAEDLKFWQKQFEGNAKKDQIDSDVLEGYLTIVVLGSNIFNEDMALTSASNILGPSGDGKGKKGGSKTNRPKGTSSRTRGSKTGTKGGTKDDTWVETPRSNALAATLVVWLNYAKGAIDISDQDIAPTIAEIEGILGNPDATRDDLNRARYLAKGLVVVDQEADECDTGAGSGSGSGSGSDTGTRGRRGG